MTKVAVITRTKDRSVFLKRAIKSVSNQTYKDYVHVIFNDGGSKEDVQAVVDSFDKDIKSRIKLFNRSKPSGAPDTIFNESIDKVDSEYVAIHDDDDTWHEEFLERSVQELDRGAAGVSVRTDNVHETLSKSGQIKRVKVNQYMPDVQAISLYRQCLDNQLPTIGFIYRRDAYESVGKYDEELPVVADWEFGIRFLRKYDVTYLDPGFALAFYHHRKKKDNSFAAHNHRTYITKVFNKYLREDLDRGELGVGYIMNDLRYQQDFITGTVRKLTPKVVTNLIRKRVR